MQNQEQSKSMDAVEINQDPYLELLQKSPAYQGGMKQTINTAHTSYRWARILSIVMFCVGTSLIVISVLFGVFSNDKDLLAVIFGGLGTINLITLLIYRPIERIQSGVHDLIRAQIVSFSFVVLHDSIARYLATTAKMPFDDTNRDPQLELERAKYLMDCTSQLIALISNQTKDVHKEKS